MALERRKVKRLFRIFFTLLFAIICFSQCYSILRNVFKYPRLINMYDRSPSLITIMPGMTICNNNRMSLKKIMGANETFRLAVEERFSPHIINDGQIRSLVERSEFNGFRDNLSRLYDDLNTNIQQIASASTVSELFELRPDLRPFISWFECARTWKDSINCGKLTQLESVASRKCATVLHSGAMLYDSVHRPELFNASSESSGPRSYFDAKEVIKIVLNFEPEDYADLKRQIGARITFHNSDFVAAIGDLDFYVARGYRYDFSIDRKDTKFIGRPYDKCLDYRKLNLDKYKSRIDPRLPLEAHTCVQNCIARNVIRRFNCWPPVLPYFRNDSLDPEHRVKYCRWFRNSQTNRLLYYELIRVDNIRIRERLALENRTEDTSDPESHYLVPDAELPAYTFLKNESMLGYRKISGFCWSKCLLPCSITSYTVSVTRSAWPTDVKILFDPTGKERAKRHCCALISIKFANFHYNIHEYKPRYQVLDTIGDVGGLLAFWLGISIISIYHGLQKLVEFCGNRSISKIKRMRSASRVGDHSSDISSLGR